MKKKVLKELLKKRMEVAANMIVTNKEFSKPKRATKKVKEGK